MSDQNNTPVQEHVLDTIQKGEVHMRPRWYFVLRAALFIVGALVLLACLFFLGSFFLFYWHGASRMPGPFFYDVRCQSYSWFSLLPWPPIIALVAILFVLDLLVRRSTSAYRRPLVVSLIVIAVVVIAGALVVDQTTFHADFSNYAYTRHLPFAEPMYRAYGPDRFRRLPAGCPFAPLTDHPGL